MALDDRLSFRRFVGLGIDDGTPDHSTISRFRSKLGKDRSAELFEEINGQLAGHGMMVKEGTLMDATRQPVETGTHHYTPTPGFPPSRERRWGCSLTRPRRLA